jgi:hypothetical protein
VNLANIYITVRSERTSKGVHLWMDKREHDTDGVRCWCNPAISLPCDECEDGCWKCDKGLIRLTPEEAEAQDEPLLIVHNGL